MEGSIEVARSRNTLNSESFGIIRLIPLRIPLTNIIINLSRMKIYVASTVN